MFKLPPEDRPKIMSIIEIALLAIVELGYVSVFPKLEEPTQVENSGVEFFEVPRQFGIFSSHRDYVKAMLGIFPSPKAHIDMEVDGDSKIVVSKFQYLNNM